MTTSLTKPVSRITTGAHRGRRTVVSLEPGDLIGFRPERTRQKVYISIASGHDLAVRQQVAADKAAKRKQRKGV